VAAAAVLLLLFGPAVPSRGAATGTVLLLASSHSGVEEASALPLRVVGSARDAGRLAGPLPAAPRYREVGRVSLPAGRYPGVSVGGVTLSAPISVGAGQVTPVLLAADAGGVLPGGVYAGNDEFNLGLSELAGDLVPLPDFSLVDQAGGPLTRASLLGKPVVIAAFHTTCHETCPLYTGALLQLRQRVGDGVRILEVTTDPVADQPAALAGYARQVGADWTFATGSPQQVESFWAPFGVTLSNGDSHDSAMILADAHGFQRIAYRGAPDLGDQLAPALVAQLDAAGFQQLASHGSGWSAQSIADALAAISSSSSASVTVPGGARAPVFTAPGLDGHRVLMDAYLGRPLVVNFFASWCGPCRDELPLLEQSAQRSPGVQFVLFDYMDDTGSARHLLDQAGVRTPVVGIDQDGQIARSYGVFGLPTTVFVWPDGTIEATVRAQLDERTLAGHLSAISGGR
jgi:cytochrome c biogenesis protein CcmG, thiol:disulfide interchange protein DsbE